MKKYNRVIALLAATTMTASLMAGCGKSEAPAQTTDTPAQTTESTDTTAAETTETTETAEATEAPSDLPSGSAVLCSV